MDEETRRNALAWEDHILTRLEMLATGEMVEHQKVRGYVKAKALYDHASQRRCVPEEAQVMARARSVMAKLAPVEPELGQGEGASPTIGSQGEPELVAEFSPDQAELVQSFSPSWDSAIK